jgi:multisubunit Na+/H+ antiporter MnhB subunit
MDDLIKTVARIMFPFMLLLGSYIALNGHLSPGGGFPAGAVIATSIAMMVLAFSEGDVEHRLTQRELVDIKSVSGIILVIMIISLGISVREDLLATQTTFSLWSGGSTILLNITGMFMVITAIVTLIYAIVKE